VNRDATLQQVWYEKRPLWLLLALLPLSGIFAVVSGLRRIAFRRGLLASHRVSCPVIVVGNISVGGTGKTPLVMWLAMFLQRRGTRVGIVTRGYGGKAVAWPQEVTASSCPEEVGDEPVMMARRTDAIVVAGPDRVAAATRAIERGARVILSDDGLQHYRLQRDIEIAVVDKVRRVGNGWLLPAGPLREAVSRLRSVDLLVESQRTSVAGFGPRLAARSVTAHFRVVEALSLIGGERRALEAFRGQPVHALAAIGNPEGFFSALQALGLVVTAHPYPDHARLTREMILFDDQIPVLMTEKDAVKCTDLADYRHWCVPMDLHFSDADKATVTAVLDAGLSDYSATF
jgi:tetraacyldisaccharide 4'-kinase